MPRGKPPIGHRFKKGVSGNPLGGKLHNPELRKIKNLTKEELKEIGALLVKGNIEDLKAIAANPKASVIQTMMAAVAVRTITKGDMHALDLLLNRLIGKVKDEVSYLGIPENHEKTVIILPDNGFGVKSE